MFACFSGDGTNVVPARSPDHKVCVRDRPWQLRGTAMTGKHVAWIVLYNYFMIMETHAQARTHIYLYVYIHICTVRTVYMQTTFKLAKQT